MITLLFDLVILGFLNVLHVLHVLQWSAEKKWGLKSLRSIPEQKPVVCLGVDAHFPEVLQMKSL